MVIQGIIRPPPEIRVVADRTALYVAKNGRTFETRILNSAKGQTPKFAFLHETSPFHAYYEERIQFYENGGTDEKENKEGDGSGATAAKGAKDSADAATTNSESTLSADNKPTTSMAQKASAIDPIAKALLAQRTKIAEMRKSMETAATAASTGAMDVTADYEDRDEHAASTTMPADATPPKPIVTSIPAPPALQFVQIVAPASLSALQLETIQLTAQFVALSKNNNSGSNINFLQELTMHEWNNPTFGFCQPRHGHFAYFSALVDAYSRILTDCGYQDVSTTQAASLLQQQQRQQQNKELIQMANNVDHCLSVVAYRAEYQRDQAERALEASSSANQTPTVAPIDWHDFVVVETIDFAMDEVVTMLPPPPPPPPIARQPNATATILTKPIKDADAMEDSDDDNEDDNEEAIRVVPSYTPKVYAAHEANARSMDMVIDPISGKAVAVKDMPEHMRIQLLDPKWAEERKKFQDKQRESNLVGGDMVASNLERFAQARGDRFGKKEQDLLSQEAESKKRLDEANRIIREQGQGSTTVGPTLPTAAGSIRKDPPTIGPSMTADEPAAKKAKVITYAPAVLQPPTESTSTVAVTAAERESLQDPFAAAATGAQAAAPVTLAVPASASAAGIPDMSNQELIPEAEFAASLAGKLDITIQIRVPNDPSQMAWNFYGQIVSLPVNVMAQVKTIKGELSTAHLNGMPANKIQLKNPSTGTFLKDSTTLAALNIGPSSTLELVPRARGGKKK